METTPNLEFNKKREFISREDAITRFFAENEIDKLNFSTPEEAKARVEMINAKYGVYLLLQKIGVVLLLSSTLLI